MSRVIIRPGTMRYITDTPAHLLDPETDWAAATDALTPDGNLTQRKGWVYDGTVADVATNLAGVWRTKFRLAAVTRTITMTSTTAYIHNSGSAGTSIGSVQDHIPRCVYNDMLVLCSPNGTSGILLYSGAPTSSIGHSSGTPTLTLGEATVTGATWSATVSAGYFAPTTPWATFDGRNQIQLRVVFGTSSTSYTLGNIRSSATIALATPITPVATGLAFPCVVEREEATITVAGSGAVTGYGTNFAAGDVVHGPAILIVPPTGNAELGLFNSFTSATSINTRLTAQATKSKCYVVRRLPCGDAASHKGSFYGAVMPKNPNRVVIGPPGWDLQSPPGAVYPWDPAAVFSAADKNYFLLKYIDVPDPDDSDPIVAILSSPGPLWVLKRRSIRGIEGSYPDFSQGLIADGIGCVDLRSAISVDEGIFFCGETGIYWSPDGQNIVDITDRKMNREWRALTRAAGTTWGSTSYVTCGVAHGHLIVSGSFGGTARSYVYDLSRREWMGRLSNLTARHMFSSRVSGEVEQLFFVDNSEQGRVMNLAPAINLSGIAKDGDGVSPSLQISTASNLGGELAEESRLLDVELSTNVLDAGAAGSTQLDLTLEHSGGLLTGGAGTQTKTLTSIDSDTTDLLDRHQREVNRSGRLHQLKLAVSPTGTNTSATKVEVSEIVLNFRNGRLRT